VALCGIKFLYQQTLGQQWASLRLVRPPRRKKLPVILSREEVRRALAAVRIPAYRACLTTVYACGLRANEGAHLRVEHIDSGRMLLRIIRGKGNQDRYVPLPEPTLQMLRSYWQTHRSRPWLFPAPARPRRDHGLTSGDRPVDRGCLYAAFRLWAIGGEIIRDVNDDPRLRKTNPRRLLLKAIECGEAPLVRNATEAQQNSCDSTARRLLRFLSNQK
jgi:integrase